MHLKVEKTDENLHCEMDQTIYHTICACVKYVMNSKKGLSHLCKEFSKEKYSTEGEITEHGIKFSLEYILNRLYYEYVLVGLENKRK